MADIGHLIDGGYVGINEDECLTIPSQCYQTVSKGKVQQTDSLCSYCCWKVTEVIKAFVLPLFYTLVLAGCSVYCWQIISNYAKSLKHPLETLSYVHTDSYESPGIAVFMLDNATFVSCNNSYYFSEVIAERHKKARITRGRSVSSLLINARDSETTPCLFSTISQYESVMAHQNTSIMVFKGPSNVKRREYMKIHFKVDQTMSDTGRFLEFFPFSNFSEWTNVFNSSQAYLQESEKLQDIWPLAVGFTTYSRLAIRVFKNGPVRECAIENGTSPPSSRQLKPGGRRTIFNPVNDIVKYLPRDSTRNYTPHYENMYAIFEWRDSEYELIEQVVTQNLVTTIGLTVTAVLTILRMTDLTKVIVRRQAVRYTQNRLSCYTCCPPDDV